MLFHDHEPLHAQQETTQTPRTTQPHKKNAEQEKKHSRASRAANTQEGMTHKPKPYINKNKTQHKTPNKKHHQHQHQAYNQRKHKTPDKVPKTIASKHVNAHLFLATVTISTSFDLVPFTNQKRTTATLHTNIKNNLKSKHFKTFFF